MPYQTTEIRSFVLQTSANQSTAVIQLKLADSTAVKLNLPSDRFAAIAATLQATNKVFWAYDSLSKDGWICSSEDIPGS